MTTTERNPGALLLVEDDDDRRSLAAALEARGFEIHGAKDGAAGVTALLDHLLTLDVVVADDALPGRDGAALLELVRVAGGERDLAVVIRGASPSPGRRMLLSALDADAVVDAAEGVEATARAAVEAIGCRSRENAAAAPEAPSASYRFLAPARRAVFSLALTAALP